MKINNIEVQAPIAGNFKITPVELSKIVTMASGKTVKEVIRIKDRFSLTYKGLKYRDYAIFYNAFMMGIPVAFEYLDNEIEKTATVYITSMPRGIYQEVSSVSHSITITLEEV